MATAAVLLAMLAGCAGPRGGAGHSGRDGPEANPPGGLMQVPDAVPRIEVVRGGGANKPYTVLGRSYAPLRGDAPYAESGLASWYGRKFQGQPTASGERYDMYAMTAAHTTLPIPSYARVRNPANKREVVVRINDRGPFRDGRVIDLSYTAALRLGVLRGVAPVEVHRITNEEIRAGTWQRGGGATAYAQASGSSAGVPAETQNNRISAAAVEPVAYAPVATASFLPASTSAEPAQAQSVPVERPAAVTAQNQAAPADNGWKVPITVRGMPPAPPQDAEPPAPVPAPAPPLVRAESAEESAAPASAAGTVETIPVRQARPDPSDYAARHPVIATPLAPMQPLEPSQADNARGSSPINEGQPLTPAAALPQAAQPGSTAEGSYWLQLGAFGKLEGAERVRRNAEPSARAIASRVEIFDSQGLHRVQLGPFASREAAASAAASLRSNGSSLSNPVIVER